MEERSKRSDESNNALAAATAAILSLALFGSTAARAAAPDERPPNIVIVYVDDLGYGDVGVYGGTHGTPHLDRMAAEGLQFTDFYVAQPVCSASRAALLTGCYPTRIGIAGALGPWSRQGISDEETTLAELCRSRGYATAAFGKWHLGHHAQFLPPHHGFDEFYGIPYSNDMWPLHPDLVRLPPAAAKRKRGYPNLPLFEGDRVVDAVVTPEDQAQFTTAFTERAVAFIDAHHDAPFFVYLAHPMPHVPLFVADYAERDPAGLYGDVVREIDWSVGQVMDALRRHGIERDTLVVFASDNGPWLSYGNHGGSALPLREGKGTTFDGGVRVPCLMWWPGTIEPGRICREPLMTIDVLPTVAKLIDAELPTHRIDGRDASPLVLGEPGSRSPQEAYFFYYHKGDLESMRAGRWKLHFPHRYRSMEGRELGRDGMPGAYDWDRRTGLELYDLESDIGETRNVADEQPDVVARLQTLADAKRRDLGDVLTKTEGSGTRPPGRLADPAAAKATAPADRPNILFIFSDDHATQAIGAYGSTFARTPTIDRLAAEGMVFDNCHVTNSICAPSRAVILSGRHSHHNGVLTNAEVFDGGQVTFPKLMRASGYQTAVIGKWHLKSDPTGFDHWEVLVGQGPYYNPQLMTPSGPVAHEGYTTEVITDRALAWLSESRDPERPFVLMCQHKAPHRNWQPGPDHLTTFDDVDIPVPPTLFDDYAGRASGARDQEMTIARHFSDFDLKLETPSRLTQTQRAAWDAAYGPKNEAYRAAAPEGRDLVRWRYQRYLKDYLRTIAGVDDSIARILDELHKSGLADNTIVVYSSDQGFFLGEHGWYDKRWMYEESARMPLIVRWPKGVAAGSRDEHLVQNLDFAPTFLDLAGVEVPASMQGRSLVPLLSGERPSDWRKSIYYHYYEFPGVHAVPRHNGVRTAQHKLIHYYQLEEWELFDLDEDPDELRSVYDDPAYAEVRRELTAELERLQTEYGEPTPDAPLRDIRRQRIRPSVDLPGYELVWHDEFDLRKLDATKWKHSRPGPRKGGVNVPEAISVGRGNLRITTSSAEGDDGNATYRTGMLDTEGLFETRYGYFETRMRFQREPGHWSAFWLQTPAMGTLLGDPGAAGVEIDVVEYLGGESNRGRVHHTLHWDGYGEDHKSAHQVLDHPAVTDGFHTFGLLWTEEEYVFYVDGVETWRTDAAVSRRDEYMLLSLEVGEWAGNIADATLPDTLFVDYVRVFKAGDHRGD